MTKPPSGWHHKATSALASGIPSSALAGERRRKQEVPRNSHPHASSKWLLTVSPIRIVANAPLSIKAATLAVGHHDSPRNGRAKPLPIRGALLNHWLLSPRR